MDFVPPPIVQNRIIFNQILGKDMVEIYVGPDRHLFTVHKDLLCKKIAYFDKMFNGNFKESSTQTVDLPEETVQDFDLLVEWVYLGKLRTLVASTRDNKTASYEFLNFYCLAEKLCLPIVQDLLLDQVRRFYNTTGTILLPEEWNSAYTKTTPSSGMRKFTSRTAVFVMVAHSMKLAFPATAIAKVLIGNEDLARDVVDLLLGSAGKVAMDPRTMQDCEFHCHEKNEPCLSKLEI